MFARASSPHVVVLKASPEKALAMDAYLDS